MTGSDIGVPKIKVVISGSVEYEHKISALLAAKVIGLIESQEPKAPPPKTPPKEPE